MRDRSRPTQNPNTASKRSPSSLDKVAVWAASEMFDPRQQGSRDPESLPLASTSSVCHDDGFIFVLYDLLTALPNTSCVNLLTSVQQRTHTAIKTPEMSKLWGNRSSQDNGDPEGDSSDSHLRDPDERTALLPETSSNGHHHLNPDDPAVSPYNLLSVRTLRWFSILFFFAASLWWLLLLITTFISLPGFHTKGGGWFAFA